MDADIKILNFESITRAFRNAPETLEKGVQRALKDTTVEMVRVSKREAPTNKQGRGGNLRQSIHSYSKNKDTNVITASAKYAYWVHQGTDPHIIRVKRKKVLADRRGNIFGKVVNHPGTKANPFFERTVEKVDTPKILNVNIMKSLNEIIKN